MDSKNGCKVKPYDLIINADGKDISLDLSLQKMIAI